MTATTDLRIENVTITWASMRDASQTATASFPIFLGTVTDLEVCEEVYASTNTYSGSLWRNYIEPRLPADRTHTALSVGDRVTIGDRTYVCADFGFEEITK
jgi:hypothetical protein